jgi:hypothetical protein
MHTCPQPSCNIFILAEGKNNVKKVHIYTTNTE